MTLPHRASACSANRRPSRGSGSAPGGARSRRGSQPALQANSEPNRPGCCALPRPPSTFRLLPSTPFSAHRAKASTFMGPTDSSFRQGVFAKRSCEEAEAHRQVVTPAQSDIAGKPSPRPPGGLGPDGVWGSEVGEGRCPGNQLVTLA